ncbi:MAG: glycosyltransferase family 2 protein, partial [Candidatus Marinimicrobia bacterium]|nr:glycosyltransferase family 2 protein [Candidatus Neomarinimicrobiota bacterium]
MPSKNSPVISVILPVYNGKHYLAECIESVLHQTYTNFEFIIVDDASTDNTPQILEDYLSQDERIRVITNPVNQKQTISANTACKNAGGKYLARMDADDIALPTRFEKQLEFLEADPEIGMVGTWTDTISESGIVIGQWKTNSEPGVLNWDLLFGTGFAHSSVMMRNNLLKKVGYYQSPEAEDYDLWSRISRIAKVANIPEILQQKRVWGGQLALKVPNETRDCVLQIMQNNINYLLNDTNLDLEIIRNIRMVSDKTTKIQNSRLISDIRNILLQLYAKYLSKYDLTKIENKKVSHDIFQKLNTLVNWKYSANFT